MSGKLHKAKHKLCSQITEIGRGNSLLIKQGDVKVKCRRSPPSSLFLITG